MSQRIINGAFRGQRITGQQRYAQEVSKELLARDGWDIAAPGSRIAKSPIAAWAWAQGPALRQPGATILSMTARAPVFHRRHIYVAHDVFPLTNPEWYSKNYIKTHRPLLRHHLRTAAGVIAVSPTTLEAIQPYIRPDTPTIVAPNGLTQTLADSTAEISDQEILTNYDVLPQRYFIAVGSNDPRKNYNRLIKAYSTLPLAMRVETPLLIIGGNSRRIFAEEPSISYPGIRLLEYISDSALHILYDNARAFISPSLAEGFGIPVIEAAAHGTPLLLADLPVYHWLAGNAAHYFNPSSIEEIAGAMRMPLSRNASADAEIVKRRFNWTGTAARIASFVEELRQ